MKNDEDIFADALAVPAGERDAWLDRACAGDAAQCARIAALLRAHEKANVVLAAPAGPRLAFTEPDARDSIRRYQLLEKIGEGGCGVVYLAEQIEPVRRHVALKVIRLGMDTKEVVARFEAERQALALMDHPNIARVLDGGATEGGRPFFVMEFVRGLPITQFCDERRFTPAQRLELFIDVCHAVHHAHQKGVIHRDLKPSNILVTLHDDVAVPKVIDFGIAKATQGRLTDNTVFTSFAQFIGTPAYMSPEQAEFNARDVDTRSDVYSLGVLLYELLTGWPPFDPQTLVAGGLDEIRRIIREVEPPRPSARLSTLGEDQCTTLAQRRGVAPVQFTSQLRGDLDWIVMKAMEKNRTRRYESASAFAADVRRHLGHEAVLARPPSTAYRFGRLIRRHRVAFGAITAIGLTVVAGAAVSAWQAVRATRAERAAQSSTRDALRAQQNAERGEQEQSRLRAVEAALRQDAEARTLAMRRQSYASDMNLVQQALAIDNLGRAQELLNRQRPKPGETDLRGWEWRYLWQFCRSEEAWSFSSDAISPERVTVSAGGDWLLMGTSANPGFWDLRTRRPAPLPPPLREEGRVAWAHFSPTEPLLAIHSAARRGLADARITLWNFATNHVVRQWPTESWSDALRFSADGKTLIAIKGVETGLWRVATGERMRSFSRKYTGAALAISADCGLAAIESSDGSVRVVEVATGVERWARKVAVEHIAVLMFSPDGRILASVGAGAETAIRLWDAGSGSELGMLAGHRVGPGSLKFWPDSRTLASAGKDQTIRLWEVATRQLKRTLRGHQGAVTGLDLMADGVTLVSASISDRSIRFWDTRSVQAPGSYHKLESPVVRWAFAPDSQSLVSVEPNGDVRRWHGRDYRERTTLVNVGTAFARREPPDPRAVCLPNDLPFLAIALPGGRVQVWNRERGALVREFATPVAVAQPEAFLDGGTKLLINQTSNDARLRGLFEWELATGRPTRSWLRAEQQAAYVVASDGRRCLVQPVATGNTPQQWSVIDLAAGAVAQTAWRNNARPSRTPIPRIAQFSPDGQWLAAPSELEAVVLGGPTFNEIRRIPKDIFGLNSATFSPDNRRLAITADYFEAVRILDTDGWQPLLTLEAPASGLRISAFSSDGNWLGASSLWGSLHLWRATSWAEIAAAESREK